MVHKEDNSKIIEAQKLLDASKDNMLKARIQFSGLHFFARPALFIGLSMIGSQLILKIPRHINSLTKEPDLIQILSSSEGALFSVVVMQLIIWHHLIQFSRENLDRRSNELGEAQKKLIEALRSQNQ